MTVEFGVELLPDIPGLEQELQDADLETEVDIQARGGGGGGGGGGFVGGGFIGRGAAGGLGSSLLGIGAVVGILAGILSQLEPIRQLVGFIARQFELFLTPILSALGPILNELNEAVVKFIQFTSDPVGALTGGLDTFEDPGRLPGQNRAGAAMGNALAQGLGNLVLPGAGGVIAPRLLELSDEAKKESQQNQGGQPWWEFW